jgi:transcriptional regulator with XRE-family HTH domain
MRAVRSRASEIVGIRVRELRDKNMISRNKLAERADMDVSHLARIENGTGNPTLFVLIQLATALDISLTTLIKGLTAADLPQDIKPYSEADFRRELRRRGRDA